MLAIYVDDRIKDYAVRLVQATRKPKEFKLDLEGLVQYGASPRATLALARSARANAFVDGRAYVTPDDVKALAPDVFRHRILLTYEAEAEGVPVDEVSRRLLARVEVP
jgi:MoxR-like ATPase